MKRAPIVLSSTVLGVAGLMSYHLAAPSSSIEGVSTAASVAAPSRATATSTTTTVATTSATTTSRAPTAAKAHAAATQTTRSATGEDVAFRYGDIQLKVTERNGKLSAVTVVRLNETDPHSAQIDQFAVPQLEQQALAAGSARIDGISGASYTSQAYAQSLQSALDKL